MEEQELPQEAIEGENISYMNYADSLPVQEPKDITDKLIEPEIPDYLEGRNALLNKDMVLANLGMRDYEDIINISEIISLIDAFDQEVATWEMVKQKLEMDGLTVLLLSRAKEGTQLKLLRTNIAISRSEMEDLSEHPIEEKKKRFPF